VLRVSGLYLWLEAAMQLVAYQDKKRVGFSRFGFRLCLDRETLSREFEESGKLGVCLFGEIAACVSEHVILLCPPPTMGRVGGLESAAKLLHPLGIVTDVEKAFSALRRSIL
jgi:hypothetical protein